MIVTPDPTHPSGKNTTLEAHEIEAGKTVIYLPGPVQGTVVLTDGAAYDVTDDVIAVHPDHEAELCHTIHKMHHAAGRFLDIPLPPAPTKE